MDTLCFMGYKDLALQFKKMAQVIASDKNMNQPNNTVFLNSQHSQGFIIQGTCSNKEIKLQYIPAYSRMDIRTEHNFRNISDAIYQTSIAINTLSSIYFRAFGGVFSS